MYVDNAMPLSEGNINLTSGTKLGGGVYVNVGDTSGTLTVNFKSGAVKTGVIVTAGLAVRLDDYSVTSVTITSGTFHKA